MSGLVAGTGLVSGINYSNLITELTSLNKEPITNLQNQVTSDTTDETDLDTFSSDLLAVQNDASALGNSSVLNARSATASDPSILNVTADSTAALGNYTFRSLQLAQNQQLISTGYADAGASPVGAGTVTVKEGGFVSTSTPLSSLNGGAGVNLGQIQITNQAGNQTTVDLSTATTVDQVVQDINNTNGVGVKASISGDAIVLADTTGSSKNAISVANVNNDTTASDLGLSSGTATSNTLTGSGLVKIASSTQLSSLNDGNGVSHLTSGTDFTVGLADGTQVDVSLAGDSSIGDVINSINNATGASGKLSASISTNGTGITLIDSTSGSNTLSVTDATGSTAGADLGLTTGTVSGGTLSGGRLLAGLDSVLLKSVNGGSGVGTLGQIQLTDRSGATATVDLSNASSLSDVINAINGAGLGLKASINSANDGIVVNDTTGSSNSNLIIADVGSSTAASKLNIATNSTTTSVNSGDLNRQYISQNTELQSLNGGTGVESGKINITDSTGASATVDLTTATTVGQVISDLNGSGLHLQASINSTGDGILVTDTGGGTGNLTISDQNGTTTAADLNIAGSDTGSINGAYTYTYTIGASETLDSVESQFNSGKAPLTASIVDDGSSSAPYRLELTANNGGQAGSLLIDTGSSGLNLSTLASGQNAQLELTSQGGSPLVFSSTSNTFSQVASGLTIQLASVSSAAVSVQVTQNTSALTGALQQFVTDYNTASSALSSLTAYDSTTNSSGALFNDSAMITAEQALNSLIEQNIGSSTSPVQNLADLGITSASGQLSLDQNVLNQQLSANPDAVASFFSTPTTGFAAAATTQLGALTAASTGLIAQHVASIGTKVTDLNNQITLMNSQVSAETTQLQDEFTNLESTIATLQSQQTELNTLDNLFTGDNTTSSSTGSTAAGSTATVGTNLASSTSSSSSGS
jgi:flagellar hook-associated protein 2